MSNTSKIQTFSSTFELLYYLTEQSMIDFFDVEIQGGMWHYENIEGSARNYLPKENYKKLCDVLYQYFEVVWRHNRDTFHPEFNIPSHYGKFSFGRVEDGKIIYELELGYMWSEDEVACDEDYLLNIGCTIEDGIVKTEKEWGEVEISSSDSPFNDNEQYTLTNLK